VQECVNVNKRKNKRGKSSVFFFDLGHKSWPFWVNILGQKVFSQFLVWSRLLLFFFFLFFFLRFSIIVVRLLKADSKRQHKTNKSGHHKRAPYKATTKQPTMKKGAKGREGTYLQSSCPSSSSFSSCLLFLLFSF